MFLQVSAVRSYIASLNAHSSLLPVVLQLTSITNTPVISSKRLGNQVCIIGSMLDRLTERVSLLSDFLCLGNRSCSISDKMSDENRPNRQHCSVSDSDSDSCIDHCKKLLAWHRIYSLFFVSQCPFYRTHHYLTSELFPPP